MGGERVHGRKQEANKGMEGERAHSRKQDVHIGQRPNSAVIQQPYGWDGYQSNTQRPHRVASEGTMLLETDLDEIMGLKPENEDVPASHPHSKKSGHKASKKHKQNLISSEVNERQHQHHGDELANNHLHNLQYAHSKSATSELPKPQYHINKGKTSQDIYRQPAPSYPPRSHVLNPPPASSPSVFYEDSSSVDQHYGQHMPSNTTREQKLPLANSSPGVSIKNPNNSNMGHHYEHHMTYNTKEQKTSASQFPYGSASNVQDRHSVTSSDAGSNSDVFPMVGPKTRRPVIKRDSYRQAAILDVAQPVSSHVTSHMTHGSSSGSVNVDQSKSASLSSNTSLTAKLGLKPVKEKKQKRKDKMSKHPE